VLVIEALAASFFLLALASLGFGASAFFGIEFRVVLPADVAFSSLESLVVASLAVDAPWLVIEIDEPRAFAFLAIPFFWFC